MTNEEFLLHYGIKGQKWGIRRFQNKDGSLTAAGRKRYSDEGSGNDIKSMSDDELRTRLNRLNMEKQYKQLTSKETSPGAKFVQDVLYNAAKQTATKYTADYMSKGVDYLLGKSKKK